MLLPGAERPFHHCRTKCSYDTSGGAGLLLFIFRLGTFADERGYDALFSAETSVGVIGIYGISTEPGDLDSGKGLLIPNALLQACPLIECLERMVLNERYASNLYVVDLGSKLDAFVFLAAYDRTEIRTVNAHDSVLDLLLLNKVMLLAADLLKCRKALLTGLSQDGTGDRCCSIGLSAWSGDEADGGEASLWQLMCACAALHMPDVPC